MQVFLRNFILGILSITIFLITLSLFINNQPLVQKSNAVLGEATSAESEGISNIESQITDQNPENNNQISAVTTSLQTSTYSPIKNNKLTNEVYGFLWYPYVDEESDNAGAYLEYPYLTTLAYAGLVLKKDGTINQTNTPYKVWRSARLQKILTNARSSGVKIHPRIATFGTDEVNYLLATEARRKKAVKSIIAEIKNSPVPVDGVNIDFEPVPTASRDNFTAFIKDLRTEVDKIDPRMEIVIDTFASTAKSESGFNLKELNKYVDGFFVMSFTFKSKSASTNAGSFNPISAYKNTVDQYLEKLPANKIILGFPFYTNRWSTKSNVQNALKKNNNGGGLILYKEAYAEAKAYGKKYDTKEQSAYYSYYTCGETDPGWKQVYFDDERAQIAKFNVAKNKNLKGIGFWTFNQNKGSMDTWNAIYEVFGDKARIGKPTPKAGFEEIVFTPNKNCKPPTDSAGVTNPPLTKSTTPTQIPSAGNTTLNLAIGLQGIGKTGTNSLPTVLAGNLDPKKTNAKITLQIKGPNGTDLKNITQNLTFDKTAGLYKGSVKINISNSGIYNIFISSPGYLSKRIDAQINKDQTNNISKTNLSSGDLNTDQERNLLDYNILLACSIFNTRNKTLCPDTSEFLAYSDMNSDGTVDQTDMTLWLQEYRGKN